MLTSPMCVRVDMCVHGLPIPFNNELPQKVFSANTMPCAALYGRLHVGRFALPYASLLFGKSRYKLETVEGEEGQVTMKKRWCCFLLTLPRDL